MGRVVEELSVLEVLDTDTVLDVTVGATQAGTLPSPTAKGWTSTTLKSIQVADTKKFWLSKVSTCHRIENRIHSQLIRQHLGIGQLFGEACSTASAGSGTIVVVLAKGNTIGLWARFAPLIPACSTNHAMQVGIDVGHVGKLVPRPSETDILPSRCINTRGRHHGALVKDEASCRGAGSTLGRSD